LWFYFLDNAKRILLMKNKSERQHQNLHESKIQRFAIKTEKDHWHYYINWKMLIALSNWTVIKGKIFYALRQKQKNSTY
jgi:hypothetical protein